VVVSFKLYGEPSWFHKVRLIFHLPEEIFASPEGLCFIELVVRNIHIVFLGKY